MLFDSSLAIVSPNNPFVKTATKLLQNARVRKKTAQSVIEGEHLLFSYLQKGLVPDFVLIKQSLQDILTTPHNALCDAYISQKHITQTASNGAHATHSNAHNYTHNHQYSHQNHTPDTSGNKHQNIAYILKHSPSKRTFFVKDALFNNISALHDGGDMLAVIDTPQNALNLIAQNCLILDGVQDSGNIGTLLRTAAATGFLQVILTKNSGSAFSPKALRAGMGAQFSLDIYENIDANQVLDSLRIPIYATSSHKNALIYKQTFAKNVALVIGSEGLGVSDVFLSHAKPLCLPMPFGQESLNAAVAGSVCMYEILRQRCFA